MAPETYLSYLWFMKFMTVYMKLLSKSGNMCATIGAPNPHIIWKKIYQEEHETYEAFQSKSCD